MLRQLFSTRYFVAMLLATTIFSAQMTATQAEQAAEKSAKRTRGKKPVQINPISGALKSLLAPTEKKVEKKEAQPTTHEQVKLIKLKTPKGNKVQMHALALDSKGRLLAACGGTRITREESKEGAKVVTETQPGEIRVYNKQGELEATWSLEVAPQAISVALDGTIFVAGYEKIMKLSAEGKQLAIADLPHGKIIDDSYEEIRKETMDQIIAQKKGMQSYVDKQNKTIAKLKETPQEDRTKDIKLQIKQAERMARAYEKYLVVDEEKIKKQVTATLNRKKSVSSLAVTDRDVFVATSDIKGYGFCIWRVSHELTKPEKIVKNLRGCCGNMHIGAGNGELFVAENARHRVCRYDREGELIKTFGKKDRDGINGFSSCCNPMNVCITGAGEVFTSESNVGRIKRYSSDGEFLDLIGDVDLVPGCKNVSIAVTPDHKTIYMMDMTRSHIIVMKKKSDDKKDPGVVKN